MPRNLTKPGSVLTLILSLMVGGSLTGAVYWTMRANTAANGMLLAPTDTDLDITLRRAGLDPAHLAAAGLTGGEVSTLVSNARTDLLSRFNDLSTADGDYALAKGSHDRNGRVVRSGLATAQDLSNFNAASTNKSNAESSRQTHLEACYSAATAGLSPAKLATLATLKGNSQWKMPVQYRAANRTEGDWVTLRNALANDRISTERSESPDATLHQFLLDADANSNVAAAKSSLDNGLATIESAYSTGVYGP